MNKKTIAIFAVCMVLVAALSVFTTLALLTSNDTVTNTFTSGNVTITLDEGKVYAPDATDDGAVPGKHIDKQNNRVDSNEYRMYPGMVYDKDPTIHVADNSENAYVGAIVTISGLDVETITAANVLTKLGITVTGWEIATAIHEDANGDFVIAYYQTDVKSKGDDVVLFETIELYEGATNDEVAAVNGMTITVTGYAVQAEGQTALTALQTGFDGLFVAA